MKKIILGVAAAAMTLTTGAAAFAQPYGYGDYNRGGYDRSSGLRMDHLLLNPTATRRLGGAGVDVETRGWEKPSDHAPVWIDLR